MNTEEPDALNTQTFAGNRAPLIAVCLMAVISGCGPPPDPIENRPEGPYLIVLGVAQDGGYPQAGCRRDCCRRAWQVSRHRRWVSSLALVDPATSRRWFLDLSPDFREQLRWLDEAHPVAEKPGISGIFLTHAHVGHYAGLIHLGREVLGTRGTPVHVMPRMKNFLVSSGPWDQLVRLGNIDLLAMEDGVTVSLDQHLRLTPFLVPHRDEYSETVGFRIEGPRRSALYLPDIDKWERWEVALEEILEQVDIAYLDGTFYAVGELPGRDMSEIPHPLMVETISRLGPLSPEQRAKARFIHLNHTNPTHDPASPASRFLREAGFHVARQGERFPL